jgi:hypothetical protein
VCVWVQRCGCELKRTHPHTQHDKVSGHSGGTKKRCQRGARCHLKTGARRPTKRAHVADEVSEREMMLGVGGVVPEHAFASTARLGTPRFPCRRHHLRHRRPRDSSRRMHEAGGCARVQSTYVSQSTDLRPEKLSMCGGGVCVCAAIALPRLSASRVLHVHAHLARKTHSRVAHVCIRTSMKHNGHTDHRPWAPPHTHNHWYVSVHFGK